MFLKFVVVVKKAIIIECYEIQPVDANLEMHDLERILTPEIRWFLNDEAADFPKTINIFYLF